VCEEGDGEEEGEKEEEEAYTGHDPSTFPSPQKIAPKRRTPVQHGLCLRRMYTKTIYNNTRTQVYRRRLYMYTHAHANKQHSGDIPHSTLTQNSLTFTFHSLPSCIRPPEAKRPEELPFARDTLRGGDPPWPACACGLRVWPALLPSQVIGGGCGWVPLPPRRP
jgi:hypothetical protein